MKRFLIVSVLIVSVLWVSPVTGQVLTLDHTDGLVPGDATSILINQPVKFYLHLDNPTAEDYIVIGNGFRVYSDNGANWGGLTGQFENGFNTNFVTTFANLFSVNGSGADTIGFAGVNFSASGGLYSGYNDIGYSISIGPFAASEHGKQVCLDSSWFPPGGTWKWTNPQTTIFPDWEGPHCWQIFDPNAPAGSLVLTEDTLKFVAQASGDNPADQTFEVQSDGAVLTFGLTESAPWLLLDRLSGSTPQLITTSINITGLDAGTYFDSILVTSSGVPNSPQIVYVEVEVTPAPAEIDVSSAIFFFNAVAGGDNPSPQVLSISNAGGVPLEWTVSNTETWLGLSPGSGTDAGDVTLSIDITGLAFNDYFDTITIVDPNATNSPILVPVNLTVGSDLPIIDLDYKPLYVVELNELFVFTREFQIFNGGAGTMNYDVTFNDDKIIDVSPATGTAPGLITVTFDFKSAQDGYEWEDTIWVSSNEAINSPQPVPIRLRFVTDPAVIGLNTDTISFDVYQCYQGFGQLLPTAVMTVSNLGGDGFLTPRLEFESDLFTVFADPATFPTVWNIRAVTPEVEQGTYFDTIAVFADNAINSPQLMIVRTNVLPRVDPPELMLLRDEMTILQNRNAPPQDYFVTQVINRSGGCLDWFADESLPWLTTLPNEGTVPSGFSIKIGPLQMPNGYVQDSLYLVAPDAWNEQETIRLTLFVWEYRGDVDADGQIDIGDITKLIRYLFIDNILPQPTLLMGDTDCNGVVDIGDLTLLIEYLFLQQPPPCTDPL